MTKTRGELLSDLSPHKKLPHVKTAPYLLQYCMEVGLYKHGGMGIAPLDWVDIMAWHSLNGITLHPLEAKIIFDASRIYVEWVSKAKDLNCPAPFPETN